MQSQLEQLEKNFGIEWREFKIGDLFEIRPTKNYGLSNGDLLSSKGSIPVVSNTSINNGITAYVDLEPTEKGNIITFSDTTTDEAIFYQPDDFVGYSHIQGMHKKFDEKIGKYHYLFIVTAFRNAVRGKYDYGNKFNRANAAKEKIQLPTITQNGKSLIAFDFIEQFIATLNAERLATLNAYLTTTNLKDYALTKDEQAALDGLDAVTWGTFKINNLFEKLNLKNHNTTFDKLLDTSRVKTTEFSLPLVNAKLGDNGIMFYGREKDFDSAEMTIDIVSNGAVATGTVYAQPHKVGVLWDSYLVKVKNQKVDKQLLLCLTTALQKSIKTKFGWDNKAVWSKVQHEFVSLPINKDKTPNYDYMSLVISAMQKVVIKKVVDYLDVRIEKTGNMVG